MYVVVEMEACYPSYVVYRHNKRVNLQEDDMTTVTRSPAIAEGPRDAGVPVEIW